MTTSFDNRLALDRSYALFMSCLRIAALCLVASCAAATANAETHQFKATRFYITYSASHPPALRIKPGDRVVTQTIDAEGRDAADVKVADTPNPQIGPFFIEGAEPGDTLVVKLVRLETNRATARIAGPRAPYTLDPQFLRSRAERQAERETWTIDKQKGVARTTTAGMKPGPLELPIAPMLGCIATAPRGNEAFTATTPGRFGGNMDSRRRDDRRHVDAAGQRARRAAVHGRWTCAYGRRRSRRHRTRDVDGHQVTVDLSKARRSDGLASRNDDYIMVLGSARPLLEALQHANTEMLTWLITDYGFDERSASILMGEALEIDTANIVDPNFTVVTKILKKYLPRK